MQLGYLASSNNEDVEIIFLGIEAPYYETSSKALVRDYENLNCDGLF
jgi:hypothetical protein